MRPTFLILPDPAIRICPCHDPSTCLHIQERLFVNVYCRTGEFSIDHALRSGDIQKVLRKGLWDLLMALRIFSHKEFSRPLRGLGHFADSNGIPWNQTLISRAILTVAIQPKFLLSLFVLLSQQCHSSQIDEVSKFDDSKLSLHRIFQIPTSCQCE